MLSFHDLLPIGAFIAALTLITLLGYALVSFGQRLMTKKAVPSDDSQTIKPGDQLYIKRNRILNEFIHGGLATIKSIDEFCCIELAGINNHRFPLTSPLLVKKKFIHKIWTKKAHIAPTKF